MKNLYKIKGAIIFGKWCLAIGLVLFIVESIYFGLNLEPTSDLEKRIDNLVKVFFFVGVAVQHFAVTDYVHEGIKLIESVAKRKTQKQDD